MIFIESKEFVGKYIRVNFVDGGYVEGTLNSIEEGGLLISDHVDDEDVNYFVPREQVLYYIYKSSGDYE